jgi:hypothetical protein
MECLQRKKIVLCLNAHQLIAGVWLMMIATGQKRLIR